MRKTFMEKILAQDDEKFIAYWTVRRYIGKGSPPREFASVEEQLEYLRNTPGAIGYLDERLESKTGLKTMLKKP
jgi:ActR/RegA family two-component response regulator